jgi:hypothetical protein
MVLSKLQKLQKVRSATKEFLRLTQALIDEAEKGEDVQGTRLSGDQRRAGLDLSRSLSRLRNPNATEI